ncbi:hypothetical protein BJX65DRAFT_302279 [Aspergillus insuetus]
MEMEIDMEEEGPDLDLALDKQVISQFKAEILDKLKQTTEALKRMADAVALADDAEDASQTRRAGLLDATSGILQLMTLLNEAEKMREAQMVMTRDGPSDEEDELMRKIMLLKPALTRMMMGERVDEDLRFCHELIIDLKEQQLFDPEEVWEPKKDRELLGEGEMDDGGDEEGIKRGHEDEGSEDEVKRRKLD